jgi:sulfate adenylyltransferase
MTRNDYFDQRAAHMLTGVCAETATLDDEGLAALDQVLLGLAPIAVLPVAAAYVDSEGNRIADRNGDELIPTAPRPWPAPADVRTSRPVLIALAGQVPASARNPPDAVLLLPAGGVRIDDARFVTWADAWRALGLDEVRTPVLPADAAGRAAQLSDTYSSKGSVQIATKAMPTGQGRVVFFTGLSGSGKSTIAREVVRELAGSRSVTLLDGDVVRTHLSKGLGFSKADRDTNIRRIGWVAAEVAKHGGVAVCAPIAPYDDTRRWVRDAVERAAGPGAFVLVWVATPLDVCEARDVKGLYADARAGRLSGFTGIDDPYEPPTDAQLVIDTSTSGLTECVGSVLARL